MSSCDFDAAAPYVPPDQEWSPSKLCDAIDFWNPAIVAQIRSMGQQPRFHTKQWEYAQLLESVTRFATGVESMVGLGCGVEPTIPRLAAVAKEVVATDLYGMEGAWKNASQRPDALWPELKNLRVHSMNMRNIDLPEESADFLWSLCAVEHVGPANAVVDVVRQAGKLLRPGGHFFLSTEYTFEDTTFYAPASPSGTLFLDRSTLKRFFTETGLHLVAPLDLRLSTHPMNVPVWDQMNNHGAYNIPHVIYRCQPMPFWGTYGGCVSMVLCKEDKGADYFLEDPDQRERLEPMWRLGRKLSRRLTLPSRWWMTLGRW
jgi:SAM-dependent methyltransferase